jgi:predicted hydrocarbon binding protein
VFTLEAKGHFLLELDPGGDACALISGLSQAVLSTYLKKTVTVHHPSCEARKHELCRWEVSGSEG